MRLRWVLLPLFSAIVVNARSDLARRQDDEDSTSASSGESSSEPPSSTTTEDASTTSENVDTTVTITTTVDGEASTVTSRTTRTITSTSTFIEVSTDRETTTVTSRDQPTATETEYTTTTITRSNNAKRDIYLIPRTAEADPTEAVSITPAPTATGVQELKREAQPGAGVFKRDTVTEVETVTDGNGGGTTIEETITRTIVTVTTRRSTTTEVITETEQADASTTVTTTRTFTVIVITGGTSVFTEAPTSTETNPAETSGSDNNPDNGGGGLSTGAKAGIGAGAGVAGLAIIAGLAWFCFRKRRGGSKPEHDDMFGSSEVPIGAAAAGGASRPMTHQPSTSASYTRSPTLPNVAPEGYRGTAMGDGRAGYAKPEPYGSAYTRQSAMGPPSSVSPASPTTPYSRPTDRNSTLMGSSQGGDYLPEHQHPADMSGGAAYAGRAASTSPGPHAAELGHEGHGARWQSPGATEMDNTPAGYHQNGQVPPNVYEMPGQDHR
jgi:hypothetical protein